MSDTVKTGTITLEVNEEFFENLKKQKLLILRLLSSELIPEEKLMDLQGVLSLFDHIQDKAADKLGMDETVVFIKGPDEETQPEEFQAWQDAYRAEVKELDDAIINNYKKKFY